MKKSIEQIEKSLTALAEMAKEYRAFISDMAIAVIQHPSVNFEMMEDARRRFVSTVEFCKDYLDTDVICQAHKISVQAINLIDTYVDTKNGWTPGRFASLPRQVFLVNGENGYGNKYCIDLSFDLRPAFDLKGRCTSREEDQAAYTKSEET